MVKKARILDIAGRYVQALDRSEPPLPPEVWMWVAGEAHPQSPGFRPLFCGDRDRMVRRADDARAYGRLAHQPVRLVRCRIESASAAAPDGAPS